MATAAMRGERLSVVTAAASFTEGKEDGDDKERREKEKEERSREEARWYKGIDIDSH